MEGKLRFDRTTEYIVAWLELHWRDNGFNAIAGNEELAHEILDRCGITASSFHQSVEGCCENNGVSLHLERVPKFGVGRISKVEQH